MIFSIILVILLIFIFFWALQCHKQSEYEYYQNNIHITPKQIQAGAEVIGGALGINKKNIATQLSNAGSNFTNVFKKLLTNHKNKKKFKD
jgi:hypothetical protein